MKAAHRIRAMSRPMLNGSIVDPSPVSTAEINEAIRTYLGSDAKGGVLPYGMEQRVRAKYGADAPEVLEAVRVVVDMDGLLEDREGFELPSLGAIADVVSERLRVRRPDLSDDVCRAVGNYVCYSFR